MKFKIGKYKVTHMGWKNLNYLDTIWGPKLTPSIQKRDLRVTVDSSMKTSAQLAAAIKKANQLGYIVNGVVRNTGNIRGSLYKSMKQLQLEYCVQYCSPHLKKDITELEEA